MQLSIKSKVTLKKAGEITGAALLYLALFVVGIFQLIYRFVVKIFQFVSWLFSRAKSFAIGALAILSIFTLNFQTIQENAAKLYSKASALYRGLLVSGQHE